MARFVALPIQQCPTPVISSWTETGDLRCALKLRADGQEGIIKLFRYSACEGLTYCRLTYFKRISKGLGSAPYVEVRDTRLPHACAERGDIPKAPRKLPKCSKCVVLGHRKNVRLTDQFEPNFL
uniref:Uncharacterized protein n=1 Tax=Triticum urartu TaxID=4572 RepID=A0A8R7Q1T3_TRIUA